MPTAPQDRQKKSHAETATEPFEFKRDLGTGEGEQTFTLPPAGSIKAGLLRRLRKLDDLDMAFSILEELANPEAISALDDMDLDEFNGVLDDWQAHIGMTPGKS